MKKIFWLIAVSLTILTSCNKEQFHSNRLYVGEGRWKIESIQYQTYDSTGAVIYDSTVTDMGELVFFKSESLDGLWDYRLGSWVHTDTAGTHGYTFQYVFDGERIDIGGGTINGFVGDVSPISGVYTAVENKKRKQVWEIITIGNFNEKVTSLGSRTTMTLKKE